MKISRQLIGNNDEVTDLRLISIPGQESISSEGQGVTHIAVASNSPAIHLFSAKNRSCTSSLEGHKDTVLCLDALHKQVRGQTEIEHWLPGRRRHLPRFANSLVSPQMPDGTVKVFLVSGSKDNTVRLWDCSGDGRLLAVGKGHINAVSAVAFGSQKSRFLVTGGADKLLKVLQPAPFQCEPLSPAPGYVYSVVGAPLDKSLFCAGLGYLALHRPGARRR
jgi:U3 small nucleolar RNA-associated protein 13